MPPRRANPSKKQATPKAKPSVKGKQSKPPLPRGKAVATPTKQRDMSSILKADNPLKEPANPVRVSKRILNKTGADTDTPRAHPIPWSITLDEEEPLGEVTWKEPEDLTPAKRQWIDPYNDQHAFCFYGTQFPKKRRLRNGLAKAVVAEQDDTQINQQVSAPPSQSEVSPAQSPAQSPAAPSVSATKSAVPEKAVQAISSSNKSKSGEAVQISNTNIETNNSMPPSHPPQLDNSVSKDPSQPPSSMP